LKKESHSLWANDKLISETRVQTANEWIDSDLHVHTKKTVIDSIHGISGIVGFTLNHGICVYVQRQFDLHYFFRKNLQDDVTHVVDIDGNIAELSPI